MQEFMLYEKKLKKSPLACENLSFSKPYEKEHIHRILPHRDPFLLIDSISKVNLEDKVISTRKHIDPKDPVFLGHFPQSPVYPGVLQVEMMGQTGLCLSYFVKNNTTKITVNAHPVNGLLVKIHKAVFIKPIFPQDNITILAQMVEHDEFLGIVASQVTKDKQVCSYCILEVYFNE